MTTPELSQLTNQLQAARFLRQGLADIETLQTSRLASQSNDLSYAVNSMIESNLSAPGWTATQSTRRFANTGLAVSGQFLFTTTLNPIGNASGVGEFRYQFILPPGSSGATFAISLAEPSSKAVTIGIYDSDMSAVLATKVCATSATFQTFSIALPANTGIPTPHLYAVFVQTNIGSVQASPSACNATLTPTFSTAVTGTFAPDATTGLPNFVRLVLSQSLATCNTLAGVNGGLYPRVNGYAEYPILTNASTVAIEAFNIAADGVLWAMQNGAPLLKVGSGVIIPNGGLGMQDVSLNGSASSMRSFKVRSGTASGAITAVQLASGGNLTAPRALYLPGTAAYSIAPSHPLRLCIISGDSVTGGSGATNPGFQGWFARFREWYPGEVVIDGLVSQSLITYVGPGDLPQQQKIYAQYLARGCPSDIVIDLGNNDYVLGTWSAAAFQQALTGVAVNLLALAPQANIWLKSMGITQSQEATANGAGSTPPQYRAATLAVVTAMNDPRVRYIDGIGALFWLNTDLIDIVHPNTTGHGKGAEAMIAAFTAVYAS